MLPAAMRPAAMLPAAMHQAGAHLVGARALADEGVQRHRRHRVVHRQAHPHDAGAVCIALPASQRAHVRPSLNPRYLGLMIAH